MVNHIDQRTRILRHVRGIGHHKRHRFAGEPHPLMRQHRPSRQQRLRAVLAGEIKKTHRLHITGTHRVFAGEHGLHAGIIFRGATINGNNARMRPVGTQKMPVQLPRQISVRNKFSVTGKQAEIFQPRHLRAVDVKGGRVHFSVL